MASNASAEIVNEYAEHKPEHEPVLEPDCVSTVANNASTGIANECMAGAEGVISMSSDLDNQPSTSAATRDNFDEDSLSSLFSDDGSIWEPPNSDGDATTDEDEELATGKGDDTNIQEPNSLAKLDEIPNLKNLKHVYVPEETNLKM